MPSFRLQAGLSASGFKPGYTHPHSACPLHTDWSPSALRRSCQATAPGPGGHTGGEGASASGGQAILLLHQEVPRLLPAASPPFHHCIPACSCRSSHCPKPILALPALGSRDTGQKAQCPLVPLRIPSISRGAALPPYVTWPGDAEPQSRPRPSLGPFPAQNRAAE